jgi:hypothetical protein
MSIVSSLAAVAAFVLTGPAFSQDAQGRGGSPPTPKEAAAIDLAGYWVSVVTEDWMFRMVTPPKGEFLGVPLNAEGRRVANAWDPAADEATGEQCRAYGAPALMRLPGRLHIAWEGESTLKIEAEAGEQVRILRFQTMFAGSVPPPSWQGLSMAQWEVAGGPDRIGNLKATTSLLRSGYLRKNGVPYSANAQLTEYYDVYDAPNGDTWLVVTTEVRDPVYLTTPFITSSHFKKLSDEAGRAQWKPEPCAIQ